MAALTLTITPDAKTDKLNFVVSGADVKWKDIVKQVNKNVSPVDPTDPVVPTGSGTEAGTVRSRW